MKKSIKNGRYRNKKFHNDLTVMSYAEAEEMLRIQGCPTVEHIQDIVERVLMDNGFVQTAKAYILYRER